MKSSVYATITLCLLLLGCANGWAAEQVLVLDKFLGEVIGLNTAQVESLHRGKALAKVMDSSTPDQVFVFGAVYVTAAPESYLKLASDLAELRKLPSYLSVRGFSNPPQISDLDGFNLNADELKELRDCKPNDCEVQLPSETMVEFQRAVKWNAPDAAKQANRIAQQMVLDGLVRYQQGGNAALGVYRDKDHPTQVAQTFQSLLARLQALPVYLPEFNQYLLEYPKVKLANTESDFYWEKVNFGLKPTLRVVQRIVYRGTSPAHPVYVVALKQLYSNHYFQTALDLTACVRDQARPNQSGFYLITVKGSQQSGLTGLKGSIIRKVAVDKTRSSLEQSLAAIKGRLEAPAQ